MKYSWLCAADSPLRGKGRGVKRKSDCLVANIEQRQRYVSVPVDAAIVAQEVNTEPLDTCRATTCRVVMSHF